MYDEYPFWLKLLFTDTNPALSPLHVITDVDQECAVDAVNRPKVYSVRTLPLAMASCAGSAAQNVGEALHRLTALVGNLNGVVADALDSITSPEDLQKHWQFVAHSVETSSDGVVECRVHESIQIIFTYIQAIISEE